MRTRNILTGLRVALAWAGLALFGYVVAGLVGGAIPANRDWRDARQGVRIFVESNGVHTQLVLPKVAAGVDWRGLARADQLRDPRYAGYDHVAFGWGEARFFLETPTWWDVRPGTVLAAAVGSERTLLHVAHGPAPAVGADVRAMVLTPAEYRRLAEFVRASLAPGGGHRFGYGANDAFYPARGRYDALQTCNAWTGDALRTAGVRVGAWTPFAQTVLWWF